VYQQFFRKRQSQTVFSTINDAELWVEALCSCESNLYFCNFAMESRGHRFDTVNTIDQ